MQEMSQTGENSIFVIGDGEQRSRETLLSGGGEKY